VASIAVNDGDDRYDTCRRANDCNQRLLRHMGVRRDIILVVVEPSCPLLVCYTCASHLFRQGRAELYCTPTAQSDWSEIDRDSFLWIHLDLRVLVRMLQSKRKGVAVVVSMIGHGMIRVADLHGGGGGNFASSSGSELGPIFPEEPQPQLIIPQPSDIFVVLPFTAITLPLPCLFA